MNTRFMVYGIFDGKHVNFWNDGRTYKTEKYAKRVVEEHQYQWNTELLIKPVEATTCPTCGTCLVDGKEAKQ